MHCVRYQVSCLECRFSVLILRNECTWDLVFNRFLCWSSYEVLNRCEKNMKTCDGRFPRCNNYKSSCQIHCTCSCNRCREHSAHFVTRSLVEVTKIIRLILFEIWQLLWMPEIWNQPWYLENYIHFCHIVTMLCLLLLISSKFIMIW